MLRSIAENYPDCVHAHSVKCPSCGAHGLRVRGLMQQTYTREHFCGQCGKTLYDSAEIQK